MSQLLLRVRDETGRHTLLSPVTFIVDNGTIPQPVGDMTSPNVNDVPTGTVTITG